MRPPSDPGPGSHDDVLRRRLETLRSGPGSRDEVGPDADGPGLSGAADPLALPVPGRHVSRRPGQGPRDVVGRAVRGLVPAPLRGRVSLGGAQLAVVSLVVAVALSLTAWWVLRADARAVEAPAPVGGLEPTADLVTLEPVAAGAGTSSSGPDPTTKPDQADTGGAGVSGEGGRVTVDVAGKVRRPSVVTLPAGSRVVDALERAGGAVRGVDLSPLNLARVLVDGEQVLVGAPGGGVALPPPGSTAAPPAVSGAPATAPSALVDLNTADAATLETLPEVGPVTAAAIMAWREENGGFTAVEELLEVDGIGEVTLSQIAPHATV